jgi:hypothetical protein
MRLTENERLELSGMRSSFASADATHAVGEFTEGITDLLESGDPNGVYRALAGIERVKSAFQRMHNYNHTVGMLAAKAFLESEFPDLPWDEIEFAGEANKPGADIYVVRPPVRVVGELKTTEPCGGSIAGQRKFGSKQKEEIQKDLRKLSDPQHDGLHRYMFVTTGLAYHCLIRDYRTAYPTICFVLLSGSPEISRPLDRRDSK